MSRKSYSSTFSIDESSYQGDGYQNMSAGVVINDSGNSRSSYGKHNSRVKLKGGLLTEYIT